MQKLPQGLALVAVMVLVGSPTAPLAAPGDVEVSSPLTEMPERFQESSEEEGTLVGVWRAVTGTQPPPPQTVQPSAKRARPQPLTLREYLNQRRAPKTNEELPASMDAAIPPDEKAPPAGTWLQFGF